MFKRISLILIMCSIGLLTAMFVLDAGDSAWSPKYLWWKHLNGPYSKPIQSAIIHDKELREFIIGNDLASVYSRLNNLSNADDDTWIDYYFQDRGREDVRYLKFEESIIYLRFENDTCTFFGLLKG